MSELLGSQNIPVDQIAEILHGLANCMRVRSHYGEDHPAVAKADAAAAEGFSSVLSRRGELVLALIDGEFVVNERPFPELRRRLSLLAEALSLHGLECIVFQRGVTAAECCLLGRTLSQPVKGDTASQRTQLQAGLSHVLLRFATLRHGDAARGARKKDAYIVPVVHEMLAAALRAVAEERPCDLKQVRAAAEQIVESALAQDYVLQQRAHTDGVADDAAHAVNVALMTTSMMLQAGRSEEACVEGAAAALLHDFGIMLLPAPVRTTPLPLLGERDVAVYRQHPVAGASALLAMGCPALWVAAALEHHRGVDGKGYPLLEGMGAPYEIVRLIALASYFDRRRTIAGGTSDKPEEALRRAGELESRYFGTGTVARFLSALGVYPPGTIVELSTGATAIVRRANPSTPLRPQVEVLFGKDVGKRIDLRDPSGLEDRYAASIVKAIYPPLALAPPEASAPMELEVLGPADDVPLAELEELGPADDEPASPAILQLPVGQWPSIAPASIVPRRLSSMAIPRDDGDAPRPVADVIARPSRPSMPAATQPSSRPPQRASTLPPPISRSQAPPDAGAIERISPLDRVPRLSLPVSAVAGMDLDPRAAFVASLVDGSLTLDEILDIAGLERWEAASLLELLIQRGVLSVG